MTKASPSEVERPINLQSNICSCYHRLTNAPPAGINSTTATISLAPQSVLLEEEMMPSLVDLTIANNG